MKVVKFKKDINIYFADRFFKLKKKKYYILPEQAFKHIINGISNGAKKIKTEDIKKVCDFQDIEEKIKSFNINDKKAKTAIIVRSGGLGDIVALTGLSNYLLDNTQINKVIIFTRHFYIDALKKVIVDDRIKIKSIFGDNLENFMIDNENIKSIYFEGIIETSKENWYDVHYKRVGLNPDSVPNKYKRPIFLLNKIKKLKNEKSNIPNSDEDKIKILLIPRSTSYTRSMKLYDLLEITDRVILEKGLDRDKVEVYIHKENMMGDDYSTAQIWDKFKVNIIEKSTMGDFVVDLYNSDFIISVDTAGIHIAEGLEKPAIGLYAAFPVEARNKYYKYTKSIDIKSPCEYQPCFLHPLHKNGCDKFLQLRDDPNYLMLDKNCAPCLSSDFVKDLYDQVINKSKDYLMEVEL